MKILRPICGNITKCPRFESAVHKRFYTPPTRRTWSKQNPKFAVRRPLVEPFNLGKAHAKTKWWKLATTGSKVDTYMGFPDVAKLEQRGGSLYTHLMDAPTLVMVVHRCLDKGVKDEEIWNNIALQALKLAMSMDPYILTMLFLYFSKAPIFNYKFVATFTGRILATLSKFTLTECANVLIAMENSKFYHANTAALVLQHAHAQCVACNIDLEQSLHFIVACKHLKNVPKNIIIAIGELLQVEGINIARGSDTTSGNVGVDPSLLHEALDSCCCMEDRISVLGVSRLYNECCEMLHSDPSNHDRNLALLNAMVTYSLGYEDDARIISLGMQLQLHEATLEQMCRYLLLSPHVPQFDAQLVAQEVLKPHNFKQLEAHPQLAQAALQGLVPLQDKMQTLKPNIQKLLEHCNGIQAA